MSASRRIAISQTGQNARGFTVGEWLVHWTWMYFISQISSNELEQRFDQISPEMPGALDPDEWDENVAYIELLRGQCA